MCLIFQIKKVAVIYLLLLFFSILRLLNFIDFNSPFIKKNKFGLDLQGGSYLLLEVDSDPLLEEKLQNQNNFIKKNIKKNLINFKDFKVSNKNIIYYTYF